MTPSARRGLGFHARTAAVLALVVGLVAVAAVRGTGAGDHIRRSALRHDHVFVLRPGSPGPARPAAAPGRRTTRTAAPATGRVVTPSRPVGLGRAVGQKIVARLVGPYPSAALLGRVRRGELGGIILFSDNVIDSRQVRSALDRLERAARAGGNPPLLITVDQEGGAVKRFPSLPPFLAPSAMGSGARAQGLATGRALRALGVSVDLAPVADVPRWRGSFLGTRAFGTTSAAAARGVRAFATGLAAGGVRPTLKHFPGLGLAAGNTDHGPVRISASRAALQKDYQPFRAALADTRALVMVGSASYPALDPSGLPAVLSPAIVRGELRGRVGLGDGVVITDDLEAPALAAYPDAVVRASRAGVDLLLLARTPSSSAVAYRRLVAATAIDPSLRRAILRSAGRIRTLKTMLAKGTRSPR